MAYCKIGFHAGLGGAKIGISEYMQKLDAAGIPFCLKSIADAGLVMEAAKLSNASGVPHNIILRWTSYPGYVPHDNEQPDLSLPPIEAAARLWNGLMARWDATPELHPYKDLIWIEPTNEIDTNANAEFLSDFTYEIGWLALTEEFRVLMSGFNAGQPRPEHWMLPGFQRYLEMCADYPNQLGISIHEGKLGKTNSGEEAGIYTHPTELYPSIIGRFESLFDVCDSELGIPRPSTFISEWSWGYDNMPGVISAMGDVEWLAEYVAKFDALKGVFLWRLDGSGELPGKLNALIGPITDLTLSTRYPDPKPIPSPTPLPTPDIGTVVYILKPTNLNAEEDQVVNDYAYHGITLPDGRKTAGLHTETFSHTDALRNVEMGNSSSILIVIEGARIGTGLNMAWLEANYPVAAQRAVFVDLPDSQPTPTPLPTPKYTGVSVSFSPAIHAPGSDWMWADGSVRSMISTLGMPVKFLTNGNNFDAWVSFKHPAFELVRLWYQPHEYRTPVQVFTDMKPDIAKWYSAGVINFELFNEPNLPSEGLGTLWDSGKAFGLWIYAFGDLFLRAFPKARLYYPGLSPGVPYTNQFAFTDAAWPYAAPVCWGFCMHAYTGIVNDVTSAISSILSQVFAVQERYAMDRPLIISEASVNRGTTKDSEKDVLYRYKANVYRSIENVLAKRPGVKGIVWFVSKWDPPADQAGHMESWVGTSLPTHYLSM